MLRKWLRLEQLSFDREIVAITVASTLLVMVDYYYELTPVSGIDGVGLYLLIPLAMVVFGFRRPVREYGFTLGDWKAGFAITGAAVMVMAPVLWAVGRADPSMRTYYSWQATRILPLMTFLDLLGWEFLFRGFVLFGYEKKFGVHALWLQAVPFAMAHITKPAVETLSTIFGGFAFGWVAWRTRSFLYPFLIHWFVATFTILVAAGWLG
ncbi:MAG: CPBP family intramembrane metalloprotease [Anaerolineales bacterium]|nr:CPBP family intramembrane metalloprotease [Anaerolineales bacterium]